MDEQRSGFQAFLGMLKRRRVVRVAIVYGVVAYAALEAADLLIPALGLPGWLLSALVITAIVGFPIALALSWLFDITPEGIVRAGADPGNGESSGAWLSTGSIAIIAGAVIAIAAGWWLSDATRMTTGEEGPDPIRSLAVLPFTNESESSDEDYFAEGLSEELRALLSRLGGLDVAASASSRRFAASEEDLVAVADRLGVGAVLTGVVDKDPDRVRVSAELLSPAEGGTRLWSGNYERVIDDIFAVESEIAGSIVEALELRLPRGVASPMDEILTTNAMAYDKYLWGLFNHNRGTAAGARDAVDNFRMAIGFDSAYAPAWTGLAESLAQTIELSIAEDPDVTVERGLAAADAAVRLRPRSAGAHAARAYFLQRSWDWAGAESELERALDADPESVLARLRLAQLSIATGRTRRAVAEARAAVRIDPLSPAARRTAARVFGAAGRVDDAIAEAQRAIQLAPEEVGAWIEMGFLFLEAERFEDARNAFDGVAELASSDPEIGRAFVDGARSYATTGERAQVPDGLERLVGGDPLTLAICAAALGQVDVAVAHLRAAKERRSPGLGVVLGTPMFLGLGRDPRIRTLREEIGLVP